MHQAKPLSGLERLSVHPTPLEVSCTHCKKQKAITHGILDNALHLLTQKMCCCGSGQSVDRMERKQNRVTRFLLIEEYTQLGEGGKDEQRILEL